MAAGRPATAAAAVVLLACAAPLLLWPAGGHADDGVAATVGPADEPLAAAAWCERKECECSTASTPTADNEQQQPVSVRCTFTGDKNVELRPYGGTNKDLLKSLVSVELRGDGRGNLTVHGKTFAAYDRLRSFDAAGFAEVTVKRQGLQAPNAAAPGAVLAVSVGRARRVLLETDAVHPQAGRADVLVEDCDAVRLEAEVAARLRTFAFRRIGRLQLSENTFKNAAGGLTIENMTLENLSADRLPSRAFITTIDQLRITDCAIGSIERNAFPVNTMGNATLTNVTVDLLKTEAFQQSLMITNLMIRQCRFREMENNSIMSVVQSIHIEHSEFGTVRSSAVSVANELTLRNNTFEYVERRGFVLRDFRSVHVDGNRFGLVNEYAFAEEQTSTRQPWSEVHVCDNTFLRPVDDRWTTAFQLLTKANDTRVTGNRFVGWCGCESWRLVAVVADGHATATVTAPFADITDDAADAMDETDDEDDDDGDFGWGIDDDYDAASHRFVDTNYCRPNKTGVDCANLTAEATGRDFGIAEFRLAAGCGQDASAYARCVAAKTAAARRNGADGFRLTGKAIVDQAKEHSVLTLVMLFILCGFGAACAVRAVSWLNARGYFIKLRSALTSNSGGGGGGGSHATGGRGGRGDGLSSMDRTMSAHSLSPMSVHEYAELRRQVDGGGGGGRGGHGRGGHADGVRVFVYQDRGTQTVPEELTHEMLQTLRDKLDDPEDYAEARGMIEHLYDLIRVEESCCGGGGGVSWTSDGLDDMTSTITTKAVQVDGRDRPDVRSVGTDAPSIERLWPPRAAKTVDGRMRRGPQPTLPRPPVRRWTGPPSVRDDYATPADYLRGDDEAADAAARRDDGYYDDDDDDADAALYCELADLRPPAPPRDNNPRPAVPPPPVPDKPTLV